MIWIGKKKHTKKHGRKGKSPLTLKTRRFLVCNSRGSSMPLLSTSFSRIQRKRLRSLPAASLATGGPSPRLRRFVAGLISSFMWNAVCQLLPARVGIRRSPIVFRVDIVRDFVGFAMENNRIIHSTIGFHYSKLIKSYIYIQVRKENYLWLLCCILPIINQFKLLLLLTEIEQFGFNFIFYIFLGIKVVKPGPCVSKRMQQ